MLLEDHIRKNKRATILVCTFMALLFSCVIFAFGYIFTGSIYLGLIFGIPIAIVYIAITYSFSVQTVLSAAKARPANPQVREEKLFIYKVEEMAIAAGLPTPKAYVQDSDNINAFATGKKPENSVICITTGALRKLKPDELEGVMGHEMSHILNRDILIATVTIAVVGTIALLSEILFYSLFWGGGGTPEINVPITNHDYGTVSVGDSVTWNATVENIGTGDLEINNVAFTGTGCDYLSCPLTFPITIDPGHQSEIPIIYEPQDIGPLDAIATIESNDPVNPQVDITLIGNGVATDPDIYLPEESHNYGSVRIHATTRWLMEVQNLGNDVLTIDSITSDDSHFFVDEQVTFPLDMGVLESVEIGIWFQPDTDNSFDATLTITSNDPDENPYYASVEGTGIDTEYPIGDLLWQYEIDTSYDNSPKAIAPITDVSGDGIDDVVICSEDDYVRCFNGNSHGYADVLWEHEIYSGSIYSQKGLAITEDVNSDGFIDVVVGAAWGGRLIRTISGRTGDTIWTHDTHEYGDGGWVYSVDCSYDFNDDGIIDVLASTGDDSSDTGPKRIYCLDGLTGISIWESPLGGPGFSAIGIEDFTGDGQADVVAGASSP